MAHKLLLADDSVTIQRVIELTFAGEDVEVTTVGDGQMAIDRLDADPPDIILADVDMPKRDGYEVAAYVKSRPKLAHIPVVLLTGAFEPIDEARAAAAGSSDVLAKPFEPQMVINRVKELLGKKRPDDEAPFRAPEPAESRETRPQMGNPQPASRQQTDEGAKTVSLDDYFDQLDAAFSSLQPAAAPADRADDMDWPAAAPLDAAAPPASAPSPMADKPAPKAPVASKPIITNAQNAPIAPAFAADAASTAGKAVVPRPPAVAAPAAPPPAQPVAPAFAAGAATAGKPVGSVAPSTPVAPTVSAAPSAPITSTVSAAPIAPVASAVAPPAPIASTPAPTSTIAAADKMADRPIAPAAPNAPNAPNASIPPSAPVAPVASAAPKTTVNPFANLSAAKAEAAARPATPVITDEVIEDIVSRVLQRLSDRVVRETVTDIVSQTAERLVQEEIEKIKLGGQ
jgi:CheY-like chemotaxis protein